MLPGVNRALDSPQWVWIARVVWAHQMEMLIKAALHNVTVLYVVRGRSQKSCFFSFFSFLQSSPLQLEPLQQRGRTHASVKNERGSWSCGRCLEFIDIASSSVVCYYISREQRPCITLPSRRMAARAIYMSNYIHLHVHPYFTDGWDVCSVCFLEHAVC